MPLTLYEAVATALLCASCCSWILLDAASIHVLLGKARLYASGFLLMVVGRDKRWRRKPPSQSDVQAQSTTKTKKLLFLRHGESEWNLVFNKGPKPLIPFKLVAALLREFRMLVALDPGSVLFDSPLNMEGLEQAQELARALKGDAPLDGGDAADAEALRGGGSAVICSSNMRRALQTAAVAFQRPQPPPRIHILSCLQEISTNVDTVALAAPGEAPLLPRVPPDLSFPKRFDASRNAGTKPLRGHGGERLRAFCDWAMARPESTIVVAGHSLWFQSFFREYLPAEAEHDGKRFKVANGGVVACVLERGAVDFVRPESVEAVHKGFDLKKKKVA